MSYCPIDEAFKDPFVENRRKRRKNKNNNSNNNNNNNNVIEGFDCLNGSNQLEISQEHNLKGSLSKHNQGDLMSVNVRLDNSNQMNRPDEQTYLPDMSLESEYALLSDVKYHKGDGYRPPSPFTKPSTRRPDDLIVNNSMYESFNQVDNVMAIEHDTIRNQLITPENAAKNEMIYSGNHPINNDIMGNNHPMINNQQSIGNQSGNQIGNQNTSDSDKFEMLLQSYMEMQLKLDEVLQKLNKMESEPDNTENVHDIILFAIFGVFFIYILDSVYRIGKKRN
jgi:hypothetical protein